MRYTYVRQHDTTDCAAACLAMVCLHYKGDHHHAPARYDGYGPERHKPRWSAEGRERAGFTTAAVRVDRENFLSDFSLPCIAQVITDQGLAHFVVVFKRPPSAMTASAASTCWTKPSRSRKPRKRQKHKCKDYVIIGDPATELKRSAWMSSTRTSPACCCC